MPGLSTVDLLAGWNEQPSLVAEAPAQLDELPPWQNDCARADEESWLQTMEVTRMKHQSACPLTTTTGEDLDMVMLLTFLSIIGEI